MTKPLPPHLEPYKFKTAGDEPNIYRIALRVPSRIKAKLDAYRTAYGVSATNDRIRQLLRDHF